jgi:hypothetical protein
MLRVDDRGAGGGDVRHHETQARRPPPQAAPRAGAARGHRLQVRRRARYRAPVLPRPEV